MAVCTKTSQKQSEPTVKNLTMTLRNKLQNFINLMSQNILPVIRKFCGFVKKKHYLNFTRSLENLAFCWYNLSKLLVSLS